MTQIIRRAVAAVAFLVTFFTVASAGSVAHADGGPDGGYSFNSGPEIKPGAVLQQELTVGDFPFWKITLKTGQRLDVKVSVDVPAGYNPGPSPHYERLGARVYDAVRQPIHCDGGSGGTEMIYVGHPTAKSGGRFTAVCTIGTLDYNTVELAGTYYIQAGIGGSTLTQGTTLPLTVTVTTGTGISPPPAEKWTAGTPVNSTQGKPDQQSDTVSPTQGPAPAVSTDDTEISAATSGLPPWTLLMGALVAGAASALAFAQLRRARR
ncbi:hypothetical protein OG894_43795 (plasmid) [Streptomyces sp. NBC_01724]|uniref:hypothetical protein n=1 Tax=Streptomyces sp. NBC_01724 TaxID=2975922 RepID=UPI002E322CA7|nr:hypothetical protein [Streptomyces sp. NBC_01724]